MGHNQKIVTAATTITATTAIIIIIIIIIMILGFIMRILQKKKLSYRRGTARRTASVEILSTAIKLSKKFVRSIGAISVKICFDTDTFLCL